jgi:hypothetical protein
MRYERLRLGGLRRRFEALRSGSDGATGTDLPLLDQAFEPTWYLASHPEVADSKLIPLQYFRKRGARKGHTPVPWFNPDDYVLMYPDVARAGVPAALHFFRSGLAEGRLPSRDFKPHAGWGAPSTSAEDRLRFLVQQHHWPDEPPSFDSMLWFGVLRSTALRETGGIPE